MMTFSLIFMKGVWGKKNVAFLIATSRYKTEVVYKLSSFRLVVLLVNGKFRIDLLTDGQLPLVIGFEAVFLFVMSGTGFTLSNFNAVTSDASIREERTDNH